MKKKKVKSSIVIITVLLLFSTVFLILWGFNIIPPLSYSDSHFKITPFISEKDTDGDGIDDQTDILNNARAYIKTRPKYKSKYYSTGYPDDGYGVCTDVVAQALLDAGYDLQTLVDNSIKNNPELYKIEKRDPNIDFRRVVNLNVFFSENAQSLTTDINDIAAWQGGDIVCFSHHIGIVSNRRNSRGVPYVIHHANPLQVRYEEDILEKRDDIIGHYRIG